MEKIKEKARNTILTILFFIGTTFPSTGIIQEAEEGYEDSDDIQMFI